MPDNNFPQLPFSRTVQDYPKGAESATSGWFYSYPLAAAIASVSERMPMWGADVARRDTELRAFYIKEPWIAGAIYSNALRNAAFQWEIEAKSTRLEQSLTDMLNGAISGTDFGWLPFIQRFTEDWHVTDNGAFIELIRDPGIDAASKFKGENAPVIGIANLDSVRCMRTGNPITPVVYLDRKDVRHKLKWYEVIAVSESPSPIETMYGVGHSAITRIMTVAQIAYAIETFQDEKISGRQYKALHFVSGVSKSEIQDTLDRGQEEADNRGQISFILPAVLASLDPEKPVTTATIELAAFPDGFNFDEFMRWYIANIALNTGTDYQDLAPLPSGQMSGAGQSEVLHRKSRGKGPAFFMQTIQNIFMNYGVIPKGVTFRFASQDMEEETEKATVSKLHAEAAAIFQRSNILNGPAIRADLVKRNVIDEDIAKLVPEDFGADEFGKTDKPIGGVGSTTAAEDARRTKEIEKEARGAMAWLVDRFKRESGGAG